MEMTAHEIVRSYKEAKDKKKQVGILAQLNLCTPEDIKKILVEDAFFGATAHQLCLQRTTYTLNHALSGDHQRGFFDCLTKS